jgi:hypothetical protein
MPLHRKRGKYCAQQIHSFALPSNQSGLSRQRFWDFPKSDPLTHAAKRRRYGENDMTDCNEGGPAFPTTKPLDSWGDPNAGMSLRDYFAGQAMAGACGPAPDGWALSPQQHAAWAYEVADAMLAARKVQQ